MKVSTVPKYSYNFSWLGRPVIQYPQDIVAMQELIWSIQPDLIIETGKLNNLDPEAYLRSLIARIADHPAKRIDELLPWNVNL